jgi:hypothetical protein
MEDFFVIKSSIFHLLQYFFVSVYLLSLWRQVFQQSVGIPLGTINCTPLLADLFLYSYESDFVQKLLPDKNKRLAVAVSFSHA